MMIWLPGLLFIVIVLLVLVALAAWRARVKAAREHHIRHFELPQGLFANLRKIRPQLTQKDCQLVAQGLRQFFLAYLQGNRQYVSMPSQVADDLWHEFILFTRHYEAFCRRGFGAFLHHTPAVALADNRRANAGLRRTWWHCCKQENLNPRRATRLPLLFALDAKLGIAGGYTYALDCDTVRRTGGDGGGGATVVYCAGDFSSSSVDGSTDGFGDGGSGGGDGGSSDGGGCGGGGCGS